MSRIDHLVAARDLLWLDFFGGWNATDAEILEPYRHAGPASIEPGILVDWLGIETDLALHAWLTVPECGYIHLAGLPVPSDQVHAETIEYVALIVGLERAMSRGGKRFVTVELGASYGPWITAAGVLARRKGFGQIDLIAVEASKQAVPMIARHAERNGLAGVPGLVVAPVHAAVHVDDAPVFFPLVDVTSDNGAQVSTERTAKDYRGVEVEFEEVKGVTFTTLCQDLKEVDYCHLDLQGAEERLIQDAEFLETMDEKVATLYFATQSRMIEGLALRAFGSRGWRLVRERPTAYKQNERAGDVNGWTTRDGGQLWLNPRFGDRHFDL